MVRGNDVQTIAVGELRESAVHAELFGCLPDPSLPDLVNSMEVDGQVDPVLVTVDGQVVDGWRRVVAAGELGWSQVHAVVLRDAQDQGEVAIKVHMLRRELSKRQVSPLTDAWLYRALKSAETGIRGWALMSEGRGLIRSRLAERLGDPSDEKLGRYERILRLPRAMQVAVATGTLDMARALRTYRLSRIQQNDIVRMFDEFEPKQAVDRYLEA